MGTIKVIKKFIESNWIIEKAAREVLERLPLRFRYGISYGPTFRYWLGFLRESERWDRDRLEAYQFEQLKDLLIHAGKNVPYYRKLFREYGFKPEKVQCINDIKILPYLDKETLRDNANELIDENLPKNRLIRTGTGGSTGIPVAIYGIKETEEKHWATIVNLWNRIGYHPKARVVSFFHNITSGKKEMLPYKKYANQIVISRNFFDRVWLKKFIKMIKKFNPGFICGFPSHLTFFCNFMEEINEKPIEGLQGVLTYSEGVMEWQRGVMERMFGARVFSSYGMVEKVLYGGACEYSDSIHLYPQYGIAENISDCDQNSEIVGTGFINYTMPLIRYRTMDIGKINSFCNRCDRFYSVVKELEGRVEDFLVDMYSNIISIIGVGTRSSSFDNVKMYQFYQEEKGKALLRIVRKNIYRESDTLKIKSELIKKLGIGNNLDIKIIFVDDIKRTPTGKARVIIQKLDMKEVL